MRASNIRVEKINFLSIIECKVNKKINEHGYARVIGVIEAEDEMTCLSLATSETYLKIFAVGENDEQCIFNGFIENIEINSGDVKTVTIWLVTGTKMMDITARTRTFQNVAMAYKEVIQSNEKLNADIKAQSKFLETGTKQIGNLIVQYKETDWNFAKRMASCCNTFIMPAFVMEGSRYYFGLNEGQAAKRKPVDLHNYTIKKAVNEYEIVTKEKKLPLRTADSFYYIFDSREIYELGDCVELQMGEKLYIYQADAQFEGEELMNTYFLRTRNGFLRGTYYNQKLIGASLGGKIAAVTRDQVQISLDIDQEYSDHGTKNFPYSTVYSSPDGTGWYCMPEIGDRVRLYFPTEKEKHAYVISSVHLEVSDGAQASASDSAPPRSDPSNKSIKNSTGKEILFTPSSLSIINPAVGKIVLDDNEGITIQTTKSIRLKADQFVEVHSMQKDVTVTAAEALSLMQGTTRLILNKNLILKGARLKLQEKG
ncbi:hypothetical protein [Anaeromicropila populeti]|uniref:Gp5/Type VI secretion system Vgr protein OB-fold domain-containing protein n=1 Tax=Anaeromicropila populeti TaxID=37658 RepID=A0A1I6K7G2_9FIRM|nr:hypothetical protein [Anaeromicropila populeti]SFR87195.1 hypothetical protein SAMN05661086_02256 [Anaeromicropila populeti]